MRYPSRVSSRIVPAGHWGECRGAQSAQKGFRAHEPSRIVPTGLLRVTHSRRGWPCQPSPRLSLVGVTVGAHDPEAMRARWEELGVSTSVTFADAGPRGEGIDHIDLVASDRQRVGERHDIGGVTWVLV